MSVRRGFRWVRRLVWLGAIAGAVVGARRYAASRQARPELGSPATWPPLEPGEAPVAAVGDLATAATAATTATLPPPELTTPPVSDEPVAAVGDLATEESPVDGARWVEPVEGGCPLSHPIKANSNSGIYHEPGGRFYDRTQAERCYAEAAAAEADGYRAAKGS